MSDFNQLDAAATPGEPWQHILVATDLDDVGDSALKVAMARAAPHKAQVSLCHVLSSGDLDTVAAVERVRDKLGSAVASVDVFVRTGDPSEEIASCAEAIGADLVVVGRAEKPGGLLRRLFRPTVVDKVVRRAPCPVLVSRRAPATGRLLVGVDSPDADALLVAAAAEQTRTSCRVTVVHALPPIPLLTSLGQTVDALPMTDLVAAVTPGLEALIARAGLEADLRVVTGDPATALCEVAAELATDLVIVGTHARSGLARAALGSVAESVASSAPCPVLVVPLG